MYVAGFSGASSWLNGFYAPYYNATQAPAGLQACTNVGYGLSGTSTSWSGGFNNSWQSAGHPVGYYNTGSSVGNATNSFWVRDYDPSGVYTESFWDLVSGACTLRRKARKPCL